MKIARVEVDVLKVPVEAVYAAAGRTVDANWHVAARIHTADGTEGIGYIVKLNKQFVRSIAAMAREMGEALVGMNVLDAEAAWTKLTRAAEWGGPGGLVHWAVTPLDVAIWDAAGKVLGQPLYRLLGGHRAAVPAYASDNMWASLPLDALATGVQAHTAAGFDAVKLRIGRTETPEGQAQRVTIAREAGGNGVSVMVDATQTWELPYAKQAARAVQEAGAVWMEDPVHHADVDGLHLLRNTLDIPVTGGENLYTLAQFRHTLEARALDVLIIDLARVGGITPWRKAAALADSFNIPVCGHVMPEVHVHLLAAVSNGYKVEYMPRSVPLLRNMPVPQDGVMKAPDGPGHGLELDEEAYRRYVVS